MNRNIIPTAAALLALAVILGAFGAHSLKSYLSEEMMPVYKTGVEYHFYHALGLLLLGVISANRPVKLLNLSALFLGLGIILFSGSLYILAVTGIRGFGAVTPVGGLSFITGWILLLIGVLKNNSRN